MKGTAPGNHLRYNSGAEWRKLSFSISAIYQDPDLPRRFTDSIVCHNVD
jgi:hypothetical protein